MCRPDTQRSKPGNGGTTGYVDAVRNGTWAKVAFGRAHRHSACRGRLGRQQRPHRHWLALHLCRNIRGDLRANAVAELPGHRQQAESRHEPPRPATGRDGADIHRATNHSDGRSRARRPFLTSVREASTFPAGTSGSRMDAAAWSRMSGGWLRRKPGHPVAIGPGQAEQTKHRGPRSFVR